MEIDRRHVAGVAAALPASATPPFPLLIRSGHSYGWRSNDPPELIRATFKTTMTSRWHVDMWGSDDVAYLHVPSGFHFVVYPRRDIELLRLASSSVCYAFCK